MGKTAQLVKGEPSIWINQNNLTPDEFIWQDDYWTVGVSENHLQAVRNYIFNLEVHHRKKSFAEKVEDFMNMYGWQHIQS